MDDIISFGRWLKLRRIALYLTQDDLGRLAGCSAIAIRKIEADERRPSPELAEKLAQHLDLDSEHHRLFLRAARAELSAARLPMPITSGTAGRPGSLPVPSTPLLGRTQEVALVCDRLLRHDVRLLTLTGPGGVGKTRVALESAAALNGAFAAGIYFVALAPVSDPTLVEPTVAQALGVREAGARPLLDRLKAHLSARALLLVLDNFEHLASAVPLVAELLACAPRLKVLATSRAPLHLIGEHEIAVPPLPEQEAVRLFVARSQAVRADFILASEDAPAAAEICRRLDGLPLAIELAAARSKLFSPRALLARLGEAGVTTRSALWLLTGGPTDLPPRQQTLRNTIEWSYNLLSDGERRAFACLGVFASGFTVEAASAVVNREDRDSREEELMLSTHEANLTTLELLASLLDKSLLQRDIEPGGEPRFGMLETIRAYALERLAASGEAEVLRRRHATCFLQLAETAFHRMHTPDQPAWLDRLAIERDNLRAALAWALDAEPAIGLGLAGALYVFWFMRGQLSEGQTWLAYALARRVGTPQRLQARVLLAVGLLALPQGAYAYMGVVLDEALALFRELADHHGCAESLLYLSMVAGSRGEIERVRVLIDQGLELAHRIADANLISLGELFLGNRALSMGAIDQAAQHYQASLALSQQLGDPWFIGMNQLSLGRIARMQGENRQAQRHFEDALDILRSVPAPGWVSDTLHELGRLAQQAGDIGRAIACYQESLALTHEIGSTVGVPACLEWLATALVEQPDLDRAMCLLGAAAALRDTLEPPLHSLEHPVYAKAQAAANACLGEQGAADAWAMGQALSIDAIIALALATAAA